MTSTDWLGGVWVAMVTPWEIASGEPRAEVVRSLVERFSSAGVAGLFILGTTGEGTLLSPDDRMKFAECVLAASEGKLPVIVHTGHDRPQAVLELSLHAKRIGAKAVAIAPPTRYRLDHQELMDHYLSVARALNDFPLFLYDIPETTSNPLGSDLLEKLRGQAPNVAGAKVSREDWEAWQGYLKLTGEATVFIGKDEMSFPLLLLGGQGLVCSGANVFPELYVDLFRAAQNGDIARGVLLQGVIDELCHACHMGIPLAYIKTAMSVLGWDVGPTLPPLRSLSPAERSELETRLVLVQKKTEELSV